MTDKFRDKFSPKTAFITLLVIGMMAGGSAVVLDYFAQSQGEIEVQEGLEVTSQFNSEHDQDQDFSSTYNPAYAGFEDVKTSQIGLENVAPSSTEVDVEVSYDNEDVAEEVESHLVFSNLGLYETHEDDGELTVTYELPETGDGLHFSVSGTVDDHNGGLLHTPFEADTITDIGEVDYEVQTTDSHDPNEFDWAIAVIELQTDDVEIDEQTTNEGDQFYVADWNGESGDSGTYEFTDSNSDEIGSFTESGAIEEPREDWDSEPLDDSDYEVVGLRFGSGHSEDGSLDVTYTQLEIDGDNLLETEVESVHSEGNGNGFKVEDHFIGISDNFNIGTVTEVGDVSETFQVTTTVR